MSLPFLVLILKFQKVITNYNKFQVRYLKERDKGDKRFTAPMMVLKITFLKKIKITGLNVCILIFIKPTNQDLIKST